MDTSDPAITFDADGVCSHCHRFDRESPLRWFPGPEGEQRLAALLARIRAAGERGEYDCILGLSGGVDSSALALRAADWDLRVLAIHVDAGWNTEVAVSNIQRVVDYCGFDLHTIVLDWRDVRELQLAYMRSGLPNQDVPQDHAFFASLYSEAAKHRIHYVLSGSNWATEAVHPMSTQNPAMDARALRDVHRRHGSQPLRSFPTIGFWRYYVAAPFLHRIRVVAPLNYMHYSRAEAIAELEERVGFKDYGRKHGESQFTRFFQNYYLPERFGYDKRRAHLSSLILSGQITRDAALAELEEPLYDAMELAADRHYVVKKLGITETELDTLLEAPQHHHSDYRNQDALRSALKLLQRPLESALGRRLGAHG